MNRERQQAARLFESFRERPARTLSRLDVKIPRIVAQMGHVEAIDYRTTHGNKVELYRHKFAKGSRPLLCVSADGRQLMLLGGRYEWTDRGIQDEGADGRLIGNPKHGRAINPKSAGYKLTQREFAKYVYAFKPSRQLQRKAIALLKRDPIGWARAGWHRLFQAAEHGGQRANPKRRTLPKFYRQHFLAWTRGNTDRKTAERMWREYLTDPDHWNDAGWPALREYVTRIP